MAKNIKRTRLFFLALTLLFLTTCTPSPSLLTDLKEWDLVWISDSSGFGVPDLLAVDIQQDTGIKVNVHDLSKGGLRAAEVLAALKDENWPDAKLSQLSTLIPEAEFIVVGGSPLELNAYDHPIMPCMGTGPYDFDPYPPDTYTSFKNNLDAIYKEIFRARAGKPTIVRSYEIWYRPAWWKAGNVMDECMKRVDGFNTALKEVAAEFRVPFTDLSDAFNGLNHDQDPAELNYLGSDGEHPNTAGQKVIADFIRKLGYEPVTP